MNTDEMTSWEKLKMEPIISCENQCNSSQQIYFGTYTDDDPYSKSIHSSHPMIENDLRYILDS